MLFPDIYSTFGFRGPWDEIKRVQSEVNRLFKSFIPGLSGDAFPGINLWVGKESAILTAEIPGVSPDTLDISVAQDTFTIRGQRPQEEETSKDAYHRRERKYGKFSRTVQLPFRVDGKKTDASCVNGILRVQLPRLEEDKPKQISIKVS